MRIWADHTNACLGALTLLVIAIVVNPWVLLAEIIPVIWVANQEKKAKTRTNKNLKKKFNLNDDQIALLKWITAGLKIDEVRNGSGDAKYLLSNMIAKFSSASHEYLLSEKALRQLQIDQMDLNIVYSRSRFYGKKSPYFYEHSLPVAMIRDKLMNIKVDEINVLEILLSSNYVAMILRTEDDKLKLAGLNHSMPDDWNWGDNPFSRYEKVGINIVDQKIKLKGRIMR